MSRWLRALVFCGVASIASAALLSAKAAKKHKPVHLHQHGITAVPPPGWYAADYDAVQSFAVERWDGGPSAQNDSSDENSGTKPPFAYMKYREPYDALNTEVRIVVLDVDTRGGTPVETAQRWCQSVVSRAEGFAQAGPVKWHRVPGFQAGECRTRGVLYAAEKVFEVERREFVLQREAETILIEFSGPPDELVDLDPIVDTFLKSLEIAPKAPVKS
ncbi:MAG: hypothetical protein AAF658_00795 [Myxococcota bacterium]